MNFQLFKTIPNRTNRITRYQHLFLFYIILKRCLDLTYSRDGFFFLWYKNKMLFTICSDMNKFIEEDDGMLKQLRAEI